LDVGVAVPAKPVDDIGLLLISRILSLRADRGLKFGIEYCDVLPFEPLEEGGGGADEFGARGKGPLALIGDANPFVAPLMA
jgi:hypothetical protein